MNLGEQDRKLGEYDVALGRGYRSNRMRKNSLYSRLLDQHCQAYRSLGPLSKRQFTLENVIDPIKAQGGRFLAVHDKGKNQWVDITDETDRVTKTVMQALRDRASGKRNISDASNTNPDHEKSDSSEIDEDKDEGMQADTSSISSAEEELPMFRSDILGLLRRTGLQEVNRGGESGVEKVQEDEEHNEMGAEDPPVVSTLDPILQSLNGSLQAMNAQLKNAHDKIDELLHKNLTLKQENKSLRLGNTGLRDENVTLRAENEQLQLVSKAVAI